MLGYIVKRLLAVVPTILVVITVIFLIVHLAPGDPARVMLGEYASNEDVQELRHEWGLDKPLLVQLIQYYSRFLRLDLGQSLFSGEPVIRVVARSWQPTFLLAVLAILLAILLAIPLGVFASTRQNSLYDLVVMTLASIGASLPSFYLGLNFIILFSILIPIFPSQGFEPVSKGVLVSARHLILPALALSLPQMSVIARVSRSSMLEVLSKDYIVTAEAKGLSKWRVVYKHALRNSSIPIITVIGMRFGVLLGGIVVIERVFNIFGVGNLIVFSIMRRDYPVVVGGVFLIALTYVLANLSVDLSYVFLNPSIRYK